jgi:VanZ family protein
MILGSVWLPTPGGLPSAPGLDKLVHAGSFFGLAIAWRWAGLSMPVVAALGLVLGAVTEYGQGLLPWPRSADPIDFLADAVGVLVGLVVWARWRRAPERRTPPE